MKAAEDLAAFISNEMSVKPTHLHVLPRLNYVHQSDLELLDVTKVHRYENETLGKRLRDAEERIRDLEARLIELEAQNKKQENIIKKFPQPNIIEVTSTMKDPRKRKNTSRVATKGKENRIPILSLISPMKQMNLQSDQSEE